MVVGCQKTDKGDNELKLKVGKLGEEATLVAKQFENEIQKYELTIPKDVKSIQLSSLHWNKDHWETLNSDSTTINGTSGILLLSLDPSAKGVHYALKVKDEESFGLLALETSWKNESMADAWYQEKTKCEKNKNMMLYMRNESEPTTSLSIGEDIYEHPTSYAKKNGDLNVISIYFSTK